MKLRVPFLLLSVAVGGVLLWILGSVRRDTPPHAPYWSRQIEALGRLGSYKHAAAAEYAHYAEAAEAEHATGAAKLFHALAHSEQIHETNCAEAVRRLGGRYAPPVRIVVFRRTTGDNLARALEKERGNYDRYRTGAIDSALSAGNRYAARIMIRIAAGDMRQAELLERFIARPDEGGYTVCPDCGNVCTARHCDHYCPLCQAHEERYFRYD
ncbi:rubrerythrin family protein [uncultured Alistipes sp.]|uniref:rubrerythrin family protein n=1 Tax=uncultured Alistipes sp. TaxID=538949 RepID=UPI00261CCEEC|nr:rubrerythrin family protein [uncultured Alistipes sp.]